MKKGDLSKFIEQAVRAHVFHRTVQDIKARNVGTDPDELQALVDDTVREVRARRRAKSWTEAKYSQVSALPIVASSLLPAADCGPAKRMFARLASARGSRQKASGLIWPLDDGKRPLPHPSEGRFQLFASITAISEDVAQPGKEMA